MKVVHLIWGFNVGGAELMLIDIVNEQVLTNKVVVIIVNDTFEPAILKSIDIRVEVKFVKRPPASRNPWYMLKLILMLKAIKPDVIHAHQQSLIKIIGRLSIPKVLTVHDTNIELLSEVAKYNKIFSISKAVKKDLQNRYPKYTSPVIYNGIDFNRTIIKKERDVSLFRIVQIGRLDSSKKGQDILLRALAYIKNNSEFDVVIDFIGEGESKNYLIKLTEELELQQFCQFLGKRTREYIYENLNSYNLLVQPSINEGFGLTVVEAMSAEVPVLVSDNEGPMEIIESGQYGGFFRSGDVTDCANKIIDVIKKYKESDFQIELMKIPEHVKQQFNIQSTAKNYLDEYTKLVNKKP